MAMARLGPRLHQNEAENRKTYYGGLGMVRQEKIGYDNDSGADFAQIRVFVFWGPASPPRLAWPSPKEWGSLEVQKVVFNRFRNES